MNTEIFKRYLIDNWHHKLSIFDIKQMCEWFEREQFLNNDPNCKECKEWRKRKVIDKELVRIHNMDVTKFKTIPQKNVSHQPFRKTNHDEVLNSLVELLTSYQKYV